VDWNSLNIGFPSSGVVGNWASVTALAVSDTNLFAGTSMGVYLSTNMGVTWADENAGLLDSNVHTLELVDTNLFAGTASGVWRRPLSQMIASSKPPATVAQNPFILTGIQSYPNPFSQSATITFSCAEPGVGEVTIVNLLGAEVAHIFSGELGAGEHSFSWDASGVASGMYEWVVRTCGGVQRIPIIHN
jgi:hypothetical protein